MGIQLDPMAQRVLRIVLDRGMIGGAELMRLAEVKRANELMDPITVLQRQELVGIKGDISRETTLPYAIISVRPSAKEFLYNVLKHQS